MGKIYDVAIVGSGPAGMSAVLELNKLRPDLKIIILEKGPVRTVEDRKNKDRLTCGWGGAGAFSDGKLNLTWKSGGLLGNILSVSEFSSLMIYVDEQYCNFGGHQGDLTIPDKRAQELKKEVLSAGFKDFIYYPTRHWGTDNAYEIVNDILGYLNARQVEILCDTKIIAVEEAAFDGFRLFYSDSMFIPCRNVIFAGGRGSNSQTVEIAKEFGLKVESNGVDIGVRVETVAEAFEKFTDVVQSPKLIVQSGNDEVRTFCVCPYGFVREESSYGVLSVNGESFSKKSGVKSANTNFAILVHTDFTYPFDDPIGYGNEIAKLTNMLGGKKIIVQTLRDLFMGRRSTSKRLKQSIVEPTLKEAEPANLGRAIPYDFMKGILKMINHLMKVTPMNEYNVLLYGSEVKQYAQRVKLNEGFQTEQKGLHIIGDGSGWSRGILQASMMGIIAARHIAKNF